MSVAADTVFHVSDLAGLNAALRSVAAGDGAYTISLEVPDGTLRLSDALLAVNLAAGASLTIEGNGTVIDGLGSERGLMVLGGTVEIRDLAITNALARGGDGGSGFYGGGGGAGLGGGLFVGAGGTVTLRGVSFSGNAAVGGNGGDGLGTGAGGGGGLGGDGGDGAGPSELSYGGDDPTGFGGGGGIGRGATGGTLAATEAGGAGIVPGAASGGRGSDFDAGGIEGGGGGAGRLANFLGMAGGGGIAGHDAGNATPLGWGTGGFGGGSGGTLGSYEGTFGGFGGGGGGSFGAHGRGGWGGGGGGASRGTGASAGVGGGAGGRDENGAAGGGGLGGGGAIFVQAGGSLTVLGGTISGGSATGGRGGEGPIFGAAGADGRGLGSGILLQGAQAVTLAALPSGTLTVADVIADAPASPSGTAAGRLVIAAGGTVALTAANIFAGGITLQDGAVLALGQAASAGTGAIRFATGAGTLVLEGTEAPTAPLAGFGLDDTILLRGIAPIGASATLEAGNVLRVGDGVFQLALRFDAGLDLAGRRVALAAAAGGGTELRIVSAPLSSVACFRHGTAIATPHGEIPVERLRIGDAVLVRGGMARRIRWIGRREVAGHEMTAAPELRPVLLRRGALGPEVPCRDLYLSPQHAVLAGGLLIPAAALVNGASILRAAPAGGMQYCHIELDDQALVLAEGAPCETFLDADSRAMFHNADSYALLDIDPAAPPPAPLAIPRLEEGFRVDAVRRALARRAGVAGGRPGGEVRFHVERRAAGVLEGWAFDTARPGEPVELDVRAAAAVVARGVANRYRIDLDRAEMAGGRCGFRIGVPEGRLALHRARDGRWLAEV